MACANAGTPAPLLLQEVAEEAVLCLVNEQRAARGAPPLTLNLRLRAAARQHAEAAKRIKWWAGGGPQIHINPETGSTPQTRIRDAGYCPGEDDPPTNENGYDAFYQGGIRYASVTSPYAAVNWWMDSDAHRKTLLDPTYRETGVAVVLGVAQRGPQADLADGGAIFVQTFGGCSKPEPADLGQVWGWGVNNFGQVGDGSTTDRLTPVRLKHPTGVVAVAGGDAHSLALAGDGSVYAWGLNEHGQLGDGSGADRTTPEQVPDLGDVVAIAAGGSHSLAVTRDGQVFAWGLNKRGQLGDGTGNDQFSPVPLAQGSPVIAVAAGFNYSLAVTADYQVLTWGANQAGQLGDGTTADRFAPVQVAGLREVDAVAGGFSHSLALTSDGSIFAWGNNNMGQLGDHTLTDRLTPVRVLWPSYEAPPVAIAAGGLHSLALAASGIALSWGSNAYGELAHFHHNPYAWIPVLVFDLPPAAAISSGYGHNLALMPDGSLWSWGANYSGQLGDGTTTDRSLPVRVLNVSGLATISAGMHHSLAR